MTYLMAYVPHSTSNPYGWRPWQSRLGYYRRASFPLPTTSLSGLGVQLPNYATFLRARDWVAREPKDAPLPRVYVPPELARTRLARQGSARSGPLFVGPGMGEVPQQWGINRWFERFGPATNNGARMVTPAPAPPQWSKLFPPVWYAYGKGVEVPPMATNNGASLVTRAPAVPPTQLATYRINPATGQYQLYPIDVVPRGIFTQSTFQAPPVASGSPTGVALDSGSGQIQIQLPNGQIITIGTSPGAQPGGTASKIADWLNQDSFGLGFANKWLALGGLGLFAVMRRGSR